MKTFLLIFLTLSLTLADDPQADPQVVAFATGNNLFTQDVYNTLLLGSNSNILFSPFSAEAVFALTQTGAADETGQEIRTSLHLADTEEATEAEFKSVLSTLHSDHVSLITANKIFVEKGYAIKDSFKKVATDVYQADVENLEFLVPGDAAKEINEWVEDETNDKIQNLFAASDFNPETRLVLVNALYFKGNWTVPFDPTDSRLLQFYASNGSPSSAMAMYQAAATYNYYDSPELDAQILEIPFQGNEATMTIVLPNQRDGISLLEQKISNVLITPKYTKQIVRVLLPRFKIESTIDFKAVLQKLGVQKAFTRYVADFSGIAGERGDLYIAEARQKTYLDVNEVGVEGAAATGISVAHPSVVGPVPNKVFTADHPFVFYIKMGDIILFQGRLLDPMVPVY